MFFRYAGYRVIGHLSKFKIYLDQSWDLLTSDGYIAIIAKIAKSHL